MSKIEVTEALANVVESLRDQNRYYQVLAFISQAQEAAIEARSNLTKDQEWVLFTALQEYKCIVDELANYSVKKPPSGLGLFKV